MAVRFTYYVLRKVKKLCKAETKRDGWCLRDYFEMVKTITDLEKEIATVGVNEQEITNNASIPS